MEKETWALLGAATAVAVPLVYNTLKEAVFEFKKKKREENYIIIQLIFVLDKYIAECEFLSRNDGIYNPETEQVEMAYKSPVLNLSSVKGEYKYLSIPILYKLHSIETKHAQVRNTLTTLDDSYYEDAPDFDAYYAKRRELYAYHGLHVIELSEEICRQFKIKHSSWEGGFNPAESIRERIVKIRAAKSATMLRRMENRAKRIAGRNRSTTP
ncbi:hypothetical protein ACOZB2_03895 [Pantoea endophytica]|uniref:DUF4760 domain-containing protein n=1 Tax=Pantoea sp. BJ2 TaxID=3141322 RepID=A0AAU7U595_9GAMM